MISYIICMLIL